MQAVDKWLTIIWQFEDSVPFVFFLSGGVHLQIQFIHRLVLATRYGFEEGQPEINVIYLDIKIRKKQCNENEVQVMASVMLQLVA